ncbi:hypothetical protein HDA40_001898 [Hamadaea flava]|uniref:Uncharacterized protein n=1 Tax=Hamadaea flava TaxID=1742688 RepID=A0ABV8LE51_9ACTN|nr:hypothetical protein [Hamadaea flava]MCP2323391.1 hypothetical protein [Hamadaea flava]
MRGWRAELVIAADDLRSALISACDLSDESDIGRLLDGLANAAAEYRHCLRQLHELMDDPERRYYAADHPALPLRRTIVEQGQRFTVRLPHTEACRKRGIAGWVVPARLLGDTVELLDDDAESQIVLQHLEAGVFISPTNGQPYILRRTA